MVKCPTAGDIIYIDFDPSVGAEIQKRRPAIVISNNMLMTTSPFVWLVPISHGNYNGVSYPLHVLLNERTQINGTVYTEQLKSFDYTKRKWKFVEKLPPDLLAEIRKKCQLVLK